MSELRPDMTREEIDALLRFYEESGLDFPIADEPVNFFSSFDDQPGPSGQSDSGQVRRETGTDASADAPAGENSAEPPLETPIEMDPRKRKTEEPRPATQQTAHVTLPTQEVVEQAAALAKSANDLDELKKIVEAFEGCNLKRSARSTIFEGGTRGAKTMMIGGCPSRDDDISGSALSGAEGLLFEKMLASIGLSRTEDIYYGFCVPWSPPGGSAPTPLHLDICAPFLARQIELAAPNIVIVMGNVAARHVFQSRQTIVQLRGKWTTLPNFGIEAMAMFDPAMLRAQPRLKRSAWMDLLAIKSKLG